MGCIFMKDIKEEEEKEEKKCECIDFENCKCIDCNNSKCDCNPELNKLSKCQNCDNVMLYKDFIEYYGHCEKCRNL